MKYFIFLPAVCFMWSAAVSQTVPKEPKNVAIFLYDKVELLDFAGPAEVFSAAGFNTYTVSVDGEAITSQGFVDVKPQYSIANAPHPDVIVFPGGSSGPSADDVRVIEWTKRLHRDHAQFLTVCTGVYIAAKAGLLENKKVTTHWGSVARFKKSYPTTIVLENTRWVDNGYIITTAGVSAGVDGALHLVSRIRGLDEANRTARYMEYDKWDPHNGVVEVAHPFLKSIAGGGPLAEDNNTPFSPYLGEFINSASVLIEQGKFQEAKTITTTGLRFYPDSFALYARLGSIHCKLSLPAPLEESELIAMIRDGKVDDAIERFKSEKKRFPSWIIYSEIEMQKAGYYLMQDKKDLDGAIKIFKLNTQQFPGSADTFDSLGEALLEAGKHEEGIENYKIAAAMGYENAKNVLKKLGVQ